MSDDRRSGEENAELGRLRREAGERDAEISGLRAQAREDERDRRELIDAGRDRDDELAHLIRRLRSDAEIHAAALQEVREALGAAELELDDLRAVRDVLTPDALPERPGLSFEVAYVAATRSVSGDFYLAVEGPEDTTILVVGDVAGKGIEAARDAAFLRATIATTARFSDDPCRLLTWANAAMTERADDGGRFATAVCVTFSPATNRLRWATAGHPPPLRLGTAEQLTGGAPGLPLGVMHDLACAHGESPLAPGAAILLYTDGLIEARTGGELFGVERALAIVRELAADTPRAVVDRLREAVTAFGDAELADDLCLFAVSAT